jgi:Major intrinsic protein
MDRTLALWRRAAAEARAAFALVSGEWRDFWVYLAGPILGAAVGAFAYRLVRGEHPPVTVHREGGELCDGARSVRLPA